MPSKAERRKVELDFHQAIDNHRLEEVADLLRNGVDPNALGDKSGNFRYAFTALCAAISAAASTISSAHIDLAAAIHEMYPDLPKRNRQEDRIRALEIVQLLLTAGADPNRPTLSRTPLSLAVHIGDIEIVQILLDAGANPSGESWSPLSTLPRPKGGLAFFSNAIHEATVKGFTDIVKLLCQRGADTSTRDHEGKTALQLAVQYDRTEIVKFLEQQL